MVCCAIATCSNYAVNGYQNQDITYHSFPQKAAAKKARQWVAAGIAKNKPLDEALASSTDFKTMKVTELKQQPKNQNLPVSGKKADLIERLISANGGKFS